MLGFGAGLLLCAFWLDRETNYEIIDSKEPAIVWIESLTNLLLKLLDIAAIAKRIEAAAVPLVVDNTFASPYF